ALRELLHQDPYARRAYTRPRGYPADGVLLDMIYGFAKPNPGAESPLGLEIFDLAMVSPAATAVRNRRQILARAIDDRPRAGPRPPILCISAGPLREPALSHVSLERRLGDSVAVDHDGKNLEVVRQCYSEGGVTTRHVDLRKLLRGGTADWG